MRANGYGREMVGKDHNAVFSQALQLPGDGTDNEPVEILYRPDFFPNVSDVSGFVGGLDMYEQKIPIPQARAPYSPLPL